ncbi:EAL domain-containing protein [Ancylobacter radicis]|uniref:EAL domain-containing protein n=1 Tax=Ancylobacter radicis TaxID=2836179 RepID=A0ABS5RBI0_9HYPH|nr:EAL domain-containing protein [Ancylobacter radicis]MBS9478199.1 EAL domain-containing protein [Ancylobacter radicis]
MAFQPIVNLVTGKIWGHEALVRGPAGESAAEVLAQVTDANRYRFDQECRIKAVELAGRLFPDDGSFLSVNFQPNAVYRAETCIRTTLQACRRFDFDPRRLVFEFTENEPIIDVAHLEEIIRVYRGIGFTLAIDDFGAGYAGLNLLAELSPDIVKIDMKLIRGIEAAPRQQAILRAVVGLARELDITLVAEGVETLAELRAIRAFGIPLAQGYLFARPALEALPVVNWPEGEKPAAE